MKTTCEFKFCGKKGICVIKKRNKSTVYKNAATVYLNANSVQPIRIMIHINSTDDSYELKGNLLHELFEGGLILKGMKYINDYANYYGQMFFFDHGKLSDLTDEIYRTFDEITTKLEV